MREKITVVYPGVGYGKPGYARAAKQWGEHLGQDVESVDILRLPGANRLRRLVVEAGYQTLAHLPYALYRYARLFLDQKKSFNLVGSESLKEKFEGQILLSVSPLVCEILAQAGLEHYAVVGDAYVQAGYRDNQKKIKKLFCLKEENLGPHFVGKTEVVGGALLPLGFKDFNLSEKEERMREGGDFRIGFITHGAGDLATVLSLVGVLPLLRQKRIHAAFFVGTHTWMEVLLKGMARGLQLPVGNKIDGGVGTISVWSGSSREEILKIRSEILPQLDLFLSPSANEQTFAGPILVRGARNEVEEANRDFGKAGGWLRETRFSATRVWQELEPLLVGSNTTPAQLPLLWRAFVRSINLTAGERIIKGVISDFS